LREQNVLSNKACYFGVRRALSDDRGAEALQRYVRVRHGQVL
jgi:hypothetical protein